MEPYESIGSAAGALYACLICGACVADAHKSKHNLFHQQPAVTPWPVPEPDAGRRGD